MRADWLAGNVCALLLLDSWSVGWRFGWLSWFRLAGMVWYAYLVVICVCLFLLFPVGVERLVQVRMC